MDKLLDCAMSIGEQMLVSGAEVHRVEDSLTRIFNALGAYRVDVFIITSSMVVTVHTEDGQAFTQTRRITDVGTDFERLHKLNALSRRICSQKLTIEEIQAELRSIDSAKTYPQWLICLCYSMIAGSFALFFGGGLADAGVALLAGLAVGLTALICDRTVKNKIFTKFTASLITTAIAFGAFKLGWISSLDKVLIGNIMSLIPGIGLTNAIRDLFLGDSIAGLLRTIEACLSALAIAAGYFTMIFLVGGAVI